LHLVMQVDSPTGLSAALACAIVPATSVLTGILLLATHLIKKMSMTGAPPGPLVWVPDSSVGALVGLASLCWQATSCPGELIVSSAHLKVGV